MSDLAWRSGDGLPLGLDLLLRLVMCERRVAVETRPGKCGLQRRHEPLFERLVQRVVNRVDDNLSCQPACRARQAGQATRSGAAATNGLPFRARLVPVGRRGLVARDRHPIQRHGQHARIEAVEASPVLGPRARIADVRRRRASGAKCRVRREPRTMHRSTGTRSCRSWRHASSRRRMVCAVAFPQVAGRHGVIHMPRIAKCSLTVQAGKTGMLRSCPDHEAAACETRCREDHLPQLAGNLAPGEDWLQHVVPCLAQLGPMAHLEVPAILVFRCAHLGLFMPSVDSHLKFTSQA